MIKKHPIALSNKLKQHSIQMFLQEQPTHFSTFRKKLQKIASDFSYSLKVDKLNSSFVCQLGENEKITINYVVDSTNKKITKLF